MILLSSIFTVVFLKKLCINSLYNINNYISYNYYLLKSLKVNSTIELIFIYKNNFLIKVSTM